MDGLLSYLIISLVPFFVGLAALYFYTPTKKHIKFLLAFSGAYVLGISSLHLLPEVFTVGEPFQVGYYILGGFLLQLLLEFFSKGIEHGHVHVDKKHPSLFPSVIFISLCIHAFIEGMPINHHQHMHHNHLEGSSLLYGILLHKIPIALTLVGFMMASKISKTKTFITLIIFVAMAPLGMLLSEIIHFEETAFQNIQAFVIGMLLHISTTILFEASDGHKFNIVKLTATIVGFLLAFISV